MPLGLVLQRLEQQQEEDPSQGGKRGLRYIINNMKHLPGEDALTTYVETVQQMLPCVGRLASASQRLYKDRESLKPLLESVYQILEEWDAWLATSEKGTATEEDLQEHLERVAYAMITLKETSSQYDADVLARMTEEQECRDKRKKEKEIEMERQQEEMEMQLENGDEKRTPQETRGGLGLARNLARKKTSLRSL
jgi:hypothetical protein